MADMYGAVRSSEFRVKEVEVFKQWFEKYRFGDEIEIWNEGDRVGFGGIEQYPSAYPRHKVDWDADPGSSLDDEVDLAEFAAELREHLVEGEIFSVFAAGNEKLRYVSGTALVIRKATIDSTFDPDEEPFWLQISSDDPEGLMAMARAGRPVTDRKEAIAALLFDAEWPGESRPSEETCHAIAEKLLQL